MGLQNATVKCMTLRYCLTLSLFLTHFSFSRASPEFNELLESLLEVVVERRVDDRIDERVQVPQPGESVKQQRIEPTLFTYGQNECVDEERKPADDERAQDDAQRLGRFPLPGCAQTFSLQYVVGQLHFHTVRKQRGSSSSTARAARV